MPGMMDISLVTYANTIFLSSLTLSRFTNKTWYTCLYSIITKIEV